jgi:NSS family neurotransmitter:Na+ symporter
MSQRRDYFTSKWTFLLAALGMAIGAGNIWRFPRLAGQYGGSFLIPWMIFLFLWSIPLILIEFSLGKKFRLGVIGVFRKGLGRHYTWMGWFVALCTTFIMFYYSVVCGWSLKYLILSMSSNINNLEHLEFWNSYTTSRFEPVIYHILAVFLGSGIIFFGVKHGIEKAVKILIPVLFTLIIIAAIGSLSLPGSSKGLSYLFRVQIEDILNYKVWLEALSQSAWSTGAGWGLILTYSNYVKQKEKATYTAILTGIGNNLASLLCALAIIPAVFALTATVNEANQVLQAGNQGLTFIFLPQLFSKIPGGLFITPIFFFALFIAAISSLISMLELAVRIIMDYGWTRPKAVSSIGSVAIIAGIPSALSIKIFNNQDWVWGLGLILSGFFFMFFVIKTKIKNYVSLYLQSEFNNLYKNRWFLRALVVIMLIEFLLMMLWWFFQSLMWNPTTWWNPFYEYTIGTCLFQWLMVILIGLIFNSKISNLKSG